MKNKLTVLMLLCMACTSLLQGASPIMMGAPREPEIAVNNRILAVVNGKPISVMDVMKKMDVTFFKQFAQYAESPAARYQYYQINWKNTLQDMIDKELILADAEEKKLPLTQGDIRQEVEKLFGPNIIENLDKINLTYNEAAEMIKGDILIKRMMYIMANAKALNQVTPQAIRVAYETYSKENIRPDQYIYRVVSVRGKDAQESAEMANFAHRKLKDEKIPLDEISKVLETHLLSGKSTTINISGTFNHADNEVSENYKEILDKLEPGTLSDPVGQKSRANNSLVFRIFYLEEKKPGGAVPFEEVELKLKRHLTEKAVEKEAQRYLDKLHKHYNVEETYLKQMIPENFQPFALQ